MQKTQKIARLLNADELSEISPLWDSRLFECAGSTAFSGPLIQSAFRVAFCSQSDGRAIAVFDGKSLVGLLPFADLPLKLGPFTLYETGFQKNAHTLRNHLLTNAEPDACHALFSVFQSEMNSDTLVLENLVDQNDLRRVLVDCATRLGMPVDQPTTGRKIEYADLGESYEAFLATRSGQFRRQIRKRTRLLKAAHMVEIVQIQADDIRSHIPVWREIVGNSWQGESERQNVGNSDADWKLHDSLAGLGKLWLLHLDGKPAAALRMLEGPQTVYVHTMHFDQKFRALAPGLILFDAMIRDTVTRGLSRVDFNGTSKFFSRWATGHIDHFSIRIYRSNLRGKLAQAARRLIANRKR